MNPLVKKLFWLWLAILVIINVIPIGHETNQSLSSNKALGILRLDYLLHAVTFLCFGGLWVFGKIKKINWFEERELLKFFSIVILAAIGLEYLQYIIPWRSFNPNDLIANLVGALLSFGVALSTKKRKS